MDEKVKLLIIEDNSEIIDLIKLYKPEYIDILEAMDGRQAMDIYEKSYLMNRLNMVGSLLVFAFAMASIISLNYKFLVLIIIIVIVTLFLPLLFANRIANLSEESLRKYE